VRQFPATAYKKLDNAQEVQETASRPFY
jgi:hypothetical protein